MPNAPVTVFDVAAYLLKEYRPMVSKHGPMTAMKLQKLVYYCQAWSLAWDEGPLFKEKIEAWVHGPVVRKLFTLNRGKYEIRQLPPGKGNPRHLQEDQRDTVDLIIKHYGSMKPEILTALTHQEQPWQKARHRAGLEANERGNEKILHEDMQEYYSSIQ